MEALTIQERWGLCIMGFALVYVLAVWIKGMIVSRKKPINIAEKLRGLPKGTKLYHISLGVVYLEKVLEDGTIVLDQQKNPYNLIMVNQLGCIDDLPHSDCELYPSKDVLSWKNYRPSRN